MFLGAKFTIPIGFRYSFVCDRAFRKGKTSVTALISVTGFHRWLCLFINGSIHFKVETFQVFIVEKTHQISDALKDESYLELLNNGSYFTVDETPRISDVLKRLFPWADVR